MLGGGLGGRGWGGSRGWGRWLQGIPEAGMARGLKAATVRVKELAVTARPSSPHPAAQGWSSGDSVCGL